MAKNIVETEIITETSKAQKGTRDLTKVVEENTEAQNKNTEALEENTSAESKNAQEKSKLVSVSKKLSDTVKSIDQKMTLQNLQNMARTIKKVAEEVVNLTKYSVDYIENLNLMDVAFGKNSQAAREWIDNISEIYGFDESDLAKQLGTFRQFGAALGFASDKADLLAKNLTLMAGDVSSLYNIKFSQASEKLTSALTGQTKAIRSLGADITQASLQQELYRLGINESISDMNRAEKTLLIYISLERQLANAQGDLAKTLESPSNQMKVFTEQVHRLARAIGNSLLPIMAKILPVVNGIIMALTEVFNALAALLGYKAEDYDFGTALVDLDALDDGLGGVSGTADKATGSVKKLKKELLGLRGFDKLNVITTPKDTSTGTSGSGSGIGGIAGGGINKDLLAKLKEYNAHLEKAGRKAQEIRDKILEWLGFSRDANGEWKRTKTTWGFLLTQALGIGTALGIVYKIGKFLGLGGVGKGLIKVFGKVATLVGGKGAAAGGTAAAGGIAGGLGVTLGIVAGIAAWIATTVTNLKTISRMTDNMRANTQTELTTWEKISAVFAATNPILAPVVAQMALFSYATEDSTKKINIWGDSISKATTGKLKPLFDELDVFDAKIVNLDFSNKVITKKDVEVIKERTKNITDIIVNELSADKNDQLKRLGSMKNLLGAEDYEKIIEKTQKYYDKRIKSVESNEKKINKIVETARKEHRQLSEKDIEKINKLREDSEKKGVEAVTANQKELNTIYLRGKYNREAITVQEASNVLKTSKKKYQGIVKDAEKTRRETIDEANKMREAGIITEKEYNKIVKAADETKEKTIKNAQEQYEGIKKSTKEGLGENSKYIDEETGKVKSKWQVWWEDLGKNTEKGAASLGTAFKKFWDEKAKKWLNEHVFKYFKKEYWQTKWNDVKDKVDSGVENIYKKLKEKFKPIKKWLDDHILKYFKKDFWKQKWEDIKDSLRFPALKIKETKEGITTSAAVGIGAGLKADGGFVDSGQMFVARESGPELVGRIGTKTAVANNDQIVQAVSIGVQRAIEHSGIGNSRVIIEATGDSSGLMDFITYKQKQTERQYGL